MAAVAVPLRTKLVAGFDKPKPKPVAEPTHSIIYHSLDTKVDCTRFIQIKPAANDNDPIACQLVHSPLDKCPAFQALSYHHTESSPSQVRDMISLNGVVVPVNASLKSALLYLRRHSTKDSQNLYWIDALCINQSDVLEQSRHVRMLGQLLSQASRVTIWLGDKYASYQLELGADALSHLGLPEVLPRAHRPASPPSPPSSEKHGSNQSRALSKVQQGVNQLLSPWKSLRLRSNATPPTSDRSSQGRSLPTQDTIASLVDLLVNDEYWQWVWAVPVLHQAHEIEVAFGIWSCTWTQFLSLLRSHKSSGAPLKLDNQLRVGPAQNKSLRDLLQDYRDSICEDSRDHVYALVGMTAQGSEFPVDYSKTPFEVWTDTMNHMALHDPLGGNGSEWIDFGRLVKSLLHLTETDPRDASLNRSYPAAEAHGEARPHTVTIKITAHVLGSICTLGPSVDEYMSYLNLINQWKAALCANYKRDAVKVDRESRVFLRCLLDSTNEALGALASDQFRLPECLAERTALSDASYLDFCQEIQRLQQMNTSRPVSTKAPDTAEVDSTPLLFQLQQANQSIPVDALPKLGIAPRTAQLGDLVCRFENTAHALVVRASFAKTTCAQTSICGTAMVTEDLVGAVSQDAGRASDDAVPVNKDVVAQGTVKLALSIDAWILYGLVS